MARRRLLPSGLTPENLAQWIKEKHIEKEYRVDRHDFTEEEMHEFAEIAMEKGKEILDLEERLNGFKELLTKGNNADCEFVAPPTIGLKKLKDARDNYYLKAKTGYEDVTTTLYGIPDGDSLTIRFFDIEGNEDLKKEIAMTQLQEEHYGSPLFKKELGLEKKDEEEDGINEIFQEDYSGDDDEIKELEI